MGFSRVSACLRYGLKRKIAMLFAGTSDKLISNSDLLEKERLVCILSPVH